MSSRRPIAAAAALVAAGLFFATASPAFAAARTIPAGDAMYVIDCDSTNYANAAQGWSVDSTTAALTTLPEGNLVAGERCAYQAAYDATTGKSYFVDIRDLDGDFSSLFTFDPATGQSTEVNPFYEGDDTLIYIVSIAIGLDGAAYAIDEDENLFRLDLATGHLLFIGSVDDFNIFGFAVDPTTGQFWIAGDDGLRTIDVTTGAVGVPSFYDFPQGSSVQSLQVDSAGVFWILNAPMLPDSVIELWSKFAADNTNELSGNLVEGEDARIATSLLIIPASALPATGVDATIPLLAGVGILTLGGGLLLMRRRANA